MSKGVSGKAPITDANPLYKSTFTLTFALEILGIENVDPCNEGWLELGPCVQGMKLQYQLYPGQNYDIDVLIWPKVAKIWCGGAQSGWVRTWQFLERRWLSFSIRHVFSVQVIELQKYVATLLPTVGLGSLSANAKNDKISGVLLPPLEFGERRYFAPVLEMEESLWKFVQELIWSAVVEYIPPSYLDGLFDVPHVVSDVRHQDCCLDCVRDLTLNRHIPDDIEEPSFDEIRSREQMDLKATKEKDKKKLPEVHAKVKFEITLSGDELLAGAGRIVQFQTVGDHPPDLGEIIVLISSNNLPAPNDYPVVFVNVDNLYGIPVNELKILRITQLFTKWKICDEEHSSEPQPLKSKTEINFKDHHAIPLPYELVARVTGGFLECAYAVQLWGIRLPPVPGRHTLFGYEKGDRDFATSQPPKLVNNDLEVLIAVTKIDAKALGKGINAFVRGEYPLYPPRVSLERLDRESVCTNDINAVRFKSKRDLLVKPDVILMAQMTLEVSLGLVGCKASRRNTRYSRMYCLINDSDSIMPLIRCITDINDEISESDKLDDLLTGFAVDTGNVIVLYLEGPKDGYILRVWDRSEDFYPKIKPLFSCSIGYTSRIYPDFVSKTVPFHVFKMFAPLGVLLACPPVYARPTLPLPTKSALLKLGRLTAGKLKTSPCLCDMPTSAELKSFRLELCVAPRPTSILNDNPSIIAVAAEPERVRSSIQSVSRINWDK